VSFPDSPAFGPREPDRHGTPQVSLLELPNELSKRGYRSMQLCHFHLPSREDAYIADFRAALNEAQIDLHALLIDDGDITDPAHGERDTAWIAQWLATAEALGARHARVIAGKQPASAETVACSIERLKILAKGTIVRVETENWFSLLETPEVVLQVLDTLEDHVGLCADWGNWPRPRKYRDLSRIMPRAETCHAKLEFVTPNALDEEDAAACLDIARRAAFTGTYVLVNGGAGESEWEALDLQRAALTA
jgi:sugar phosphate isomerase/epimerase